MAFAKTCTGSFLFNRVINPASKLIIPNATTKRFPDKYPSYVITASSKLPWQGKSKPAVVPAPVRGEQPETGRGRLRPDPFWPFATSAKFYGTSFDRFPSSSLFAAGSLMSAEKLYLPNRYMLWRLHGIKSERVFEPFATDGLQVHIDESAIRCR